MATWATYASPLVGSLLDMTSPSAGVFVGVANTGSDTIHSLDGGQTWTAVAPAESNEWTGIASNGTTIVAVSNAGAHQVMTSTDNGASWTARSASEANSWNSVTYSSALGLFIAVASTGTHRVMTSPDGIMWTNRTAASAKDWCGVAASGSVVVAISAVDGMSMVSADGMTWSAGGTFSGFAVGVANGSTSVVYSSSASQFAIGGYDGVSSAKVALSSDGVTWSYVSPAPLSDYLVIGSMVAAPAASGFVGVTPLLSDFTPTPTIIAVSEDNGTSWTADNTTFSGGWSATAWDNATGTVVFWDAISTTTVLVGTFDVAPIVTDVSPTHGDAAGGTVVTLTGTGFTGATMATFNGSSTLFTPSSDTVGTCVSPAHAVGQVTVTVS